MFLGWHNFKCVHFSLPSSAPIVLIKSKYCLISKLSLSTPQPKLVTDISCLSGVYGTLAVETQMIRKSHQKTSDLQHIGRDKLQNINYKHPSLIWFSIILGLYSSSSIRKLIRKCQDCPCHLVLLLMFVLCFQIWMTITQDSESLQFSREKEEGIKVNTTL